MVTVERATRIKATKEAIWDMFQTREGQLQLTKGFLRDLELIGSGVGSRRIMHLEGQWEHGKVEEIVTRADFEAGELEYAVVDCGGIVPFADYKGYVKIIPDGPGASVFLIRSRFVAVDISDDEARAMSEQNIDFLIANLKEAFA